MKLADIGNGLTMHRKTSISFRLSTETSKNGCQTNQRATTHWCFVLQQTTTATHQCTNDGFVSVRDVANNRCVQTMVFQQTAQQSRLQTKANSNQINKLMMMIMVMMMMMMMIMVLLLLLLLLLIMMMIFYHLQIEKKTLQQLSNQHFRVWPNYLIILHNVEWEFVCWDQVCLLMCWNPSARLEALATQRNRLDVMQEQQVYVAKHTCNRNPSKIADRTHLLTRISHYASNRLTINLFFAVEPMPNSVPTVVSCEDIVCWSSS